VAPEFVQQLAITWYSVAPAAKRIARCVPGGDCAPSCAAA